MLAADARNTRTRRTAIGAGILSLLLAGFEAASGSDGWGIGGTLILRAAAVSNILHWSFGLLLLAVALVERGGIRPFVTVAAAGLLAAAAIGASARDSMGHFLGFDGPLPWSYVAAHAVIGIVTAFGLLPPRARVASPDPQGDTANLPR